MSKGKEKKEKNPFAVFNLVNGGIIPPDDNLPDDSDVRTGKDDAEIVDNEQFPELTEEERLAKGTKAIEENIKKAEEIRRKKEEAAAKALEQVEPGTSEEDEDEDQDEGNVETNPLKVFAKNLYEKNVLDFNVDDKEFEATEDGLEKLVSKTVDNRINKWVDSLPDEYSKFLQFVQDGGKPKDFLDIYYGNHSWQDFEVDSLEAQKIAVKESLILAGETPEDADDIISDWETADKLEDRAKKALIKLQKHETQSKAEILNKQKEAAEKQRNAEKAYWDTFKKDLYGKSELMGFKLTDKIKDQLWEFMTIPDKKSGKTQYQTAVENNKDSSLLFALQAMQGFDITKLEKQVKTKVASGLADMLRNSDSGSKGRISGGRNAEPKNEDPFALFAKAKA
jgi:hypothetical protein